MWPVINKITKLRSYRQEPLGSGLNPLIINDIQSWVWASQFDMLLKNQYLVLTIKDSAARQDLACPLTRRLKRHARFGPKSGLVLADVISESSAPNFDSSVI